MENLIKQKRVSFSGPGQEHSSNTRERTKPSWQTGSFTGDKKGLNWFQRRFPWQMSQDYDLQESEFSIAVAAAAFAINSLEEAEHRRKMREELEKSRAKVRSRKDDTTTGLSSAGRVSRRSSGKEEENAGKTSTRKPIGQDLRAQEDALKVRNPSRSSSTRPTAPGAGPGLKIEETKANTWERAQTEKIKRRYEKTKAAILAWENEKKMETRLKMERKQSELELRRERNNQHYQMKIARIDNIAREAREQVEEKRRNEESEVKDKAKKIGRTGNIPVKCFCFQCG